MWKLSLVTIQNASKPTDEADDTYAAVIKNQCDSKCAWDQKEASDSNSCPKGDNKHNNWQLSGSHHSMTYRCF
eukprot:2250241-Ditylum_brightwellii.AAC.1